MRLDVRSRPPQLSADQNAPKLVFPVQAMDRRFGRRETLELWSEEARELLSNWLGLPKGEEG